MNAIIVRQQVGQVDVPDVLIGAPLSIDPVTPFTIQHLARPNHGIVCGGARVDVGEGRWAPRQGLTWQAGQLPDVTCWSCRRVLDDEWAPLGVAS